MIRKDQIIFYAFLLMTFSLEALAKEVVQIENNLNKTDIKEISKENKTSALIAELQKDLKRVH